MDKEETKLTKIKVNGLTNKLLQTFFADHFWKKYSGFEFCCLITPATRFLLFLSVHKTGEHGVSLVGELR